MKSNSQGLNVKTTIYLSTGRGVSVITGSDRDWHGEVRLKDQHVQCVAADVKRKGIVYCGTLGDGAFVSGDGGSTWRPLEGLRAGNVTSFAVSNSGFVYAGSEPSAIFRSEDAGDTWRELPSLLTLPSSKEWSFPPRPETHHVRSILPDLAKPNRLHVAIEAGALLRSDDEDKHGVTAFRALRGTLILWQVLQTLRTAYIRRLVMATSKALMAETIGDVSSRVWSTSIVAV
jgi:hypothetical protein